MNKYFGTDGIRGVANEGNITGENFYRFALAAGSYFKIKDKKKHLAIIAKDTRVSGYMLEPALVSGLTSAGMDVITFGPIPTNALAMLTRSMKADMGIMITASHNPYHDNGLKLFGPDGLKLSDQVEKKIERLIDRKQNKLLVPAKELGRVKRLEDGNQKYIEILKTNFPASFTLNGMKVVIDCANGAGYKAAPQILQELGATVITLGVNPNGVNINDRCGSTFPESMRQAVKKNKADLGIALDGDADRIIVSDEQGTIIDGDQIIGMIATRWKNKKILQGGVVGTLMTNLGLEHYFKQHNINFVRADVGDRYVKETMQKMNYNLGGEQSGHIILGDFTTTGDGLLVGLEILFSMRKGTKASKLLKVFKPVPQILENKIVKNKNIINSRSCIAAIKKAEQLLGDQGRMLVRKSGTEPKIRIMGECHDKKLLTKAIEIVSKSIK
ncbi:MAG: phosphoglucosamine mutase [Methylophilaceae bacterium]